MNKELAKETLFDIDDIFKKYNIIYWLDCGTLLGIIREGDFIAWDSNDIDIAIYSPVFLDYILWKKLIQDFLKRNIAVHNVWGDSVFSCKKYKNEEEMIVDIHIYKKVNKEYQCAMMNNLFSFSEELFDTLDSIEFQGRKFNTPHIAKKYLTLLYGDNWHEPHPENKIWTSKNNTPYYHSELSTYSRNIPIFNPEYSKQQKVSILIPTVNRVELLKHTLNAYAKQDKSFNYEIIILNDYIQDDSTVTSMATETLVSKFLNKLNIFYIFTGQRNTKDNFKWRIPGFALNIGVKQATGNIILLACPEIYPMTKDCLFKTITPFLEGKQKIVTHPISVKDDKYWDEVLGHRWGDNVKNLNDHNELFTKTESDYNKLEPLNSHYPFFLAMYKKEYIDIGGYDEDFIGNCYDDTDIYNRLILNGCTFLPIPECKVLHLFHPRLDYTSEEIIKAQEYNKELYYEREKIIVRNVGKEWGKL